MQPTTCALCKNRAYDILYPANFRLSQLSAVTFSARHRPNRLHYRLVKCRGCGLVRSHPILPPETVNKFYRNSDILYTNEIPSLQKTYGNLLKKIAPLLHQRKRFLDIGCGNGFLLETASAFGFSEIFGIEPSRDAVSMSKTNIKPLIYNGFFSRQLFPKNSFDLVCCFHTLDHIPHPNEFLNDVKYALKPGGVALIVTHNVDSILAKLFKSDCPIIDIQHIYLFNPTTLAELFCKHEFQVLNVFSIINSYTLAYWLSMTPLPNPLKKRFNVKLLSKIVLPFPAGNIAIVARK